MLNYESLYLNESFYSERIFYFLNNGPKITGRSIIQDGGRCPTVCTTLDVLIIRKKIIPIFFVILTNEGNRQSSVDRSKLVNCPLKK